MNLESSGKHDSHYTTENNLAAFGHAAWDQTCETVRTYEGTQDGVQAERDPN
jgi:hypothetical protein